MPSTSQDFNQDYGTDDFVLQCALFQRTVRIKAHSITVDGPNGGQITTTGIGGTDLNARVTTSSNKKCLDTPGDPTAFINIHTALVEDQNSNGGITMRSCGSQTVDVLSTIKSAGAAINQICYWGGANPCTISVTKSSYFGNSIDLESQGDLTLTDSNFQTIGPRDDQRYISFQGSVWAGSNCPTVAALVNDANCIPIDQACNFCQECNQHNGFFGGVESNFRAWAQKFMSFDNACIDIAENITMIALDTDPNGVCNNRLVPVASTVINLTNSSVRDDFGKTGVISITAHPNWKNGCPGGTPLSYPGDFQFQAMFGDGRVEIGSAIIVDDGVQGGGPDPNKVAGINGDLATTAGNCSLVSPLPCTNRPIPTFESNQNTTIADPVQRGLANVTGIPKCDS